MLAAAMILSHAQPIEERLIDYTVDGVVMQGFLARPAGNSPVPGVLVIHDWDGANDYEFYRARRIASELGYAAFALDVYGKDRRPKTMQENAQMAGSLYQDRALFRRRLEAGADEFKKEGGLIPGKLAAAGYCFGGGGALELARTGYPLAAVVSFHGSLSTTLPAAKGSIKGPVMIFQASQDPNVGMDQFTGFVKEMDEAGADFQAVVYSIKGHAFTVPGGRDYSPSGDARSWSSFAEFLKTVFASASS